MELYLVFLFRPEKVTSIEKTSFTDLAIQFIQGIVQPLIGSSCGT
jgi:hypothetical protein